MVLNNEQARQLIDVARVHAGLRENLRELKQAYRYAPRWRTISGREYLYLGETSQGARNSQTDAIFKTYSERRETLKSRVAALLARLDDMAPVNRALRLGRVPKLPARILRALDAEGLLGRGLTVIGTHALFAYEIAAGEFFQSELLATADLDLCWDAKSRLTILTDEGNAQSVLSILQRVDRSFSAKTLYGIGAVNDEQFIVDLISTAEDLPEPATGLAGDISASPIPETAALLAGKPFSAMAIGEDGLPVQIICPPPDAFIQHKRAISAATSGRPALQRHRDEAQAEAVATIAHVLNAAKDMYSEPGA
ncbi:MAG: GSU2403 family nucleotidyltransferase fold protein [Hyphomicrobium sp.]